MKTGSQYKLPDKSPAATRMKSAEGTRGDRHFQANSIPSGLSASPRVTAQRKQFDEIFGDLTRQYGQERQPFGGRAPAVEHQADATEARATESDGTGTSESADQLPAVRSPRTAIQRKSASVTVQRFQDAYGREVDPHRLTLRQIDFYLNTTGLDGQAYMELRQARRAKKFKTGLDGDDARKQRAAGKTARGKAEHQEELHLRRMGKVVNGYPALDFLVEGEEPHTLYVGPHQGTFVLMIASHPLPVGTFIVEMDQRFESLKREYLANKLRAIRRYNNTLVDFAERKQAAQDQLVTTNNVFSNVASTPREKLESERELSLKLGPLIAKVNAFAVSLGNFFNVPGKGRNVVPSNTYTNAMATAQERYNIEGLVATYETQPDYPNSDFERDHQPHNDLIETVAGFGDFAGKEIGNVAADRTQKGWSILLHHDRHAAGRTFGSKGGNVTRAFRAGWDSTGSQKGTAQERRQWCIDELKASLIADANAMKAVANDTTNNYSDIDALPAGVNKGALKNRIKQQILDGEDRLLLTAAFIDDWDK